MQRRLLSLLMLLGCALTLFFLTPGVRAEAPEASGVQIQVSQGLIHLQVTQATPLRLVLEEVCRKTQAQCEGLQNVEETMPPLAMKGSWAEVVDWLLQGSKLNYVAQPASPQGPARLLLIGRRAALPARAPVGTDQPGSREAAAEVTGEPSALGVTTTSNAREPRPEEVDRSGAMEGREMVAPTEEAAPAPNLPPPGFMGGPILPPPPQLGLPVSVFPDQNGNPVPLVPQPPPSVSVFPDAQGRPVPLPPPLPPGQRPGSPFPPELSGPR